MPKGIYKRRSGLQKLRLYKDTKVITGEMQSLYETGWTLREIGCYFNYSHEWIRQLLLKRGVKLRMPGEQAEPVGGKVVA